MKNIKPRGTSRNEARVNSDDRVAGRSSNDKDKTGKPGRTGKTGKTGKTGQRCSLTCAPCKVDRFCQ